MSHDRLRGGHATRQTDHLLYQRPCFSLQLAPLLHPPTVTVTVTVLVTATDFMVMVTVVSRAGTRERYNFGGGNGDGDDSDEGDDGDDDDDGDDKPVLAGAKVMVAVVMMAIR